MNPFAAEVMLEKVRGLKPGAPVPSPCISVCRMDPDSGLCEGCLRTLDEIAAWGLWPEAEKLAAWRRIEQRALQGTTAP